MDDDFCILLVDDFSTMRRVIRRMLRDQGIENVLEAENGKQAWKILTGRTVHLVICDWNMPSMKGVDLLEKVRSDPYMSNLPFVMVTAEGKKNFVEQALEMGATGYVTKPFSSEELFSVLSSILPEGSWYTENEAGRA